MKCDSLLKVTFSLYKKSKLCFFLILIFLICPSPVGSQNKFSLSVSPPTFEINANPGDVIENSIRAENLTEEPLSITLEKRNFIAIGEEGSVNLTEDEDRFSLSSWIEVLPQKYLIPPKSSYIFKYKVSIPKDAEPGGHFGSIVFKSDGVMPTGTGAAVSQEIGTLVLVKVAGEIKEKGRLLSFEPIKKFWEYGPISFESRIKNEGNIHLKPYGVVNIKNIFGKKVATVNIDPKNILPDATRKSATVWDKKYLFGRYVAIINLSYGQPSQFLTATTHFYVIPYKLVIIAFIVSFIIVYLIYRGRHRITKAIKVLFGKDTDP